MAVKIVVRKNQLPAIAAKLPIAATNIVGTRGEEMVAIAQQHSRVDKGDMKAGWKFVTRSQPIGGTLTNEVPHTVHNEYGTRNMTAQPMARPAKEQVFPKIIDDFRHLEDHLR